MSCYIWTNASCQVWCYLSAEDHWLHWLSSGFCFVSIKRKCEEVVLLMTLYMTHLEFNYLKFMGTLSCCNEHVFMCQYVYILLVFFFRQMCIYRTVKCEMKRHWTMHSNIYTHIKYIAYGAKHSSNNAYCLWYLPAFCTYPRMS